MSAGIEWNESAPIWLADGVTYFIELIDLYDYLLEQDDDHDRIEDAMALPDCFHSVIVEPKFSTPPASDAERDERYARMVFGEEPVPGQVHLGEWYGPGTERVLWTVEDREGYRTVLQDLEIWR